MTTYDPGMSSRSPGSRRPHSPRTDATCPERALQRALALVVETKTRSDDEVLDGARYQHLTRVGVGLDASGDVHADPAEVSADQLAFPRVHSDSQLAAQCLGSGASQRHGGADCERGAVSKVASTPSPVDFTMRPREWPIE